MIAAGLLQGLGYAVWTFWPDFAGFAAGLVLWGPGGSLVSGAFEALLYDGPAVSGAASSFSLVLGRVRAAGLLAQLPAALFATVLYRLGGYPLVGWASVACCALAAGLAARLPAPNGPPAWGVPTVLVPLAALGIPLAGAVGAALAGRANGWTAGRLPACWDWRAAHWPPPGCSAGRPGWPSSVCSTWGTGWCWRAETELQVRIAGTARATVTSVAALGTEVTAFGLYRAWILGGVRLVAILVMALALSLSWLLQRWPAARPANRATSAGPAIDRAGAWQEPN